MVRVSESKERYWLSAVFVKALDKFNQVIYEELIGELCCKQEGEVFDDMSTVSTEHSDTTASRTVKTNNLRANRAFSHVNDDSPGELTEVPRKSCWSAMRKSTLPGPNKKAKWFGKSTGRGSDKELTRGCLSPVRRNKSWSLRQTRSRRRGVTPQRRPDSILRKSSTPKEEYSGTKQLQDDSPATRRDREEPPATSKNTRLFSKLRRKAGGKSSKKKCILEAYPGMEGDSVMCQVPFDERLFEL
jgi:hypothetical protein